MTDQLESSADLRVQDMIQRPGEPWHFMVIREVENKVTASIGGHCLAVTNKALRVKELGCDIYDPVIYFPEGSINMSLLEKNDKTTTCPLKGNAIYYDVVIGRNRTENAVWTYNNMMNYDKRLEAIKNNFAFNTSKVLIVEYTNRDIVS